MKFTSAAALTSILACFGQSTANDETQSNLRGLRRNGHLYQKLTAPTSNGRCPPGLEITTVAECLAAGQEQGGSFQGGAVKQGNWGNAPCGCFVETAKNDLVHYDFGGSLCVDPNFNYPLLCKKSSTTPTTTTTTTTTIPAPGQLYQRLETPGPRCPAGSEVTTVDECRAAGLQVNGQLRDGTNVIVGAWGQTPCGCFLEDHDRAIHFDTGTSECNANAEYDRVCKFIPPTTTTTTATTTTTTTTTTTPPPPTTYVKLTAPRPDGKCPPGKGITSASECQIAALGFPGSTLRNGAILTGNWGNTPCGCFVESFDGAVHFKATENLCVDPNFKFPLICKA